jgi:hypothetical protein
MTTPPDEHDLNDLTRFQVSGQAGDFLFEEGDHGKELFIVQDGQVELLTGQADERHQLVVLKTGDVFGEDGLFGDDARPCFARGVTDFRVLKIDAAALEQIIREDPDVAMGIMQQLAVRRSWAKTSAVLGPTPAQPPAVAAAPEPAGPPRLVLPDGDTTFPLVELEEAVVGRINRSTGVTPEVDLTDFDAERSLSRQHARIVQRDGRFYVREEKKTQNGTFVNGKRIKTGVDVELADGDRVRFGLIKTVFRG